ncbi:MAG: selenide, water dikinase SelD [Lachnospiraceae bacterium]|nr:selenide, water dikinase SelD [Lachnospiraceae bacterium]
MEKNEVRLTRLASCAGCGAKVGAGTLAKLLEDIKTRTDDRLIVGFDKSDDASVYKVTEDLAIVQTTDFFPPIVDDPFLYGQIAAANAISDVYAMGGEPRLALNILCAAESMEEEWIRDILRGGYDKAYEAGVIISGGHTIRGAEPIYGLAVTGFVHPEKLLTNSSAKAGDVLILTKPLGVGIITTAAKAGLAERKLMDTIYAQMAFLNKYARDIMVNYPVSSCTDVTGFGLLGHSYEMASGSDTTLVLETDKIRYHKEAYEFASMGFVPAGAYRNRAYVGDHIKNDVDADRALCDILYDPQTSGGLLISVPEKYAAALLTELTESGIGAYECGYVTEPQDEPLVLL